MRFTKTLLATAFLAALPMMASAESQFSTAAGPSSVSAKLDFQVIVPRILYLRVGTGTNLANNTNVDLITFNVNGANVGDSTSVAGTGGDLAPGVTARVVANAGVVTLSSNTPGALTTGTAGEVIPYTQITTTSAVLTSATALPAPALAASGATSVVLTATNRVTNQDAKWTFNYLNNAVVAAGIYGGTVAKNGEVTYTAAMP
ncbi:MAG: hypothetical protein ABI644_13600 [Arenimonas sp.]